MIVRIDAVIDWRKSTMFALLRHIGHTSRYEIPPRPAALRARLHTDGIALQELLTAVWRCVHITWNQKSSVWTPCPSLRPRTARCPRARTSRSR
jgi:hypothetical protein